MRSLAVFYQPFSRLDETDGVPIITAILCRNLFNIFFFTFAVPPPRLMAMFYWPSIWPILQLTNKFFLTIIIPQRFSIGPSVGWTVHHLAFTLDEVWEAKPGYFCSESWLDTSIPVVMDAMCSQTFPAKGIFGWSWFMTSNIISWVVK